MSLAEAIEHVGPLSPVSVPELRYLTAAADRVRERWPDVQVAGTEKEREALAQKLRDRVEKNDWDETRLSFVVAASSAVFDVERRGRADLARTRDFIYAEIEASTSETFLSGMLRTYLDSYATGDIHTTELASVLGSAVPRMNVAGRLLLEALPELMDPFAGPDRIAERMSKMSDPYTELLRLGVRNPHGGGFMLLAHLTLTKLVRPHLSERNLIDWYIRWLRPPGKEEGRNPGSEPAIEALIYPWLSKTPEDQLRSYLVESLIELYGDPRIKSGGAWGGIDERYMAIVHRWLTREDMRFFTGVVDATQRDAMWPPRRNFWLKLYDEGKIDAAWAALSSEAFEYARRHLMRQDAKNAYTRVAYQRARSNTSLLIMKIGNKIMVDGCHSYRTHVFDIADPMAPKLFEEGYDCDEIMYASDDRRPVAAKSHSSIDAWGRWVRDMINADVAWSKKTRPYAKVFRPKPPKPRYVPPSRTNVYSNSDRWVERGVQGAGIVRQDISGGYPSARSVSPTDRPVPSQQAIPALVPRMDTSPAPPVAPKQNRFASLTDQLIACSPEAVTALLANGRTRQLLSPKSKEALGLVRAKRGDLPLSLRNALEYLLISLKKSGVDLDELFSAHSAPPQGSATVQEAEPNQKKEETLKSWALPPLPDTAEGRLDLLRKFSDRIEEFGMRQGDFEQRKVLAIAVRKLRDISSELRPMEIGELQKLYEQLRQRRKDRNI